MTLAYTGRMDTGRIVKLAVAVVILFVAWKYVLPRVKQQHGGGATQATAIPSSSGGSCVQSALQASETWGSGLRQFVNPPYDVNAWTSLQSSVTMRITAAESDCSCASDSCGKARDAMRDLRALVNDFDSTVRNGSDPSEFVQRQEAIDNRINEAADLARDGK